MVEKDDDCLSGGIATKLVWFIALVLLDSGEMKTLSVALYAMGRVCIGVGAVVGDDGRVQLFYCIDTVYRPE